MVDIWWISWAKCRDEARKMEELTDFGNDSASKLGFYPPRYTYDFTVQRLWRNEHGGALLYSNHAKNLRTLGIWLTNMRKVCRLNQEL